jgi:GH15 family glucan-1,4-alpha-glucosidase
MGYQPIENYGLIGDMHSVALVGMNGSIDWFCVPRFDSPSIFAALLDDQKGGRFRIAPADDAHVTYKQFYWPATNVLVTRFLSAEGAAELTDFMPVADPVAAAGSRRQVIRRLSVSRGAIAFRMVCQPAFDFARAPHRTELVDGGAEFHSEALHLGLATRTPLSIDGSGVVAEFTLGEGDSAVFVLRERAAEQDVGEHLSEDEAETAFRETVAYWRHWLSRCTYQGRWREIVHRSALVLKLLTYEPTGAIVAAPTCSLPEGVGGERNWDYRYAWIRDSAFTIYAFLRLGFKQEAERFFHFIAGLGHQSEDGSLQIMYGIDGRAELTEEILDHLDGYRGSRPVRVGNAAFGQRQLDIYGELLDGLYLFNKYAQPIGYDGWQMITRVVDWVCRNWHLEDEGIWEVRGGAQHFVYSKLMCWVAIDRALRIADDRSLPADWQRWRGARDQIYREIMEKGWNEKLGAFVQSYGSDTLDAANLMMVLTMFCSPIEPRMTGTVDAILRSLDQGGLLSNNLVYRYNIGKTEDGLRGEEGTFNICTFWLVEALTRAGRFDPARLEESRLIFERMLGFANHLGLYAEETAPDGSALGNFPQAFTHLALISAAVNLDRALSTAP